MLAVSVGWNGREVSEVSGLSFKFEDKDVDGTGLKCDCVDDIIDDNDTGVGVDTVLGGDNKSDVFECDGDTFAADDNSLDESGVRNDGVVKRWDDGLPIWGDVCLADKNVDKGVKLEDVMANEFVSFSDALEWSMC